MPILALIVIIAIVCAVGGALVALGLVGCSPRCLTGTHSHPRGAGGLTPEEAEGRAQLILALAHAEFGETVQDAIYYADGQVSVILIGGERVAYDSQGNRIR